MPLTHPCEKIPKIVNDLKKRILNLSTGGIILDLHFPVIGLDFPHPPAGSRKPRGNLIDKPIHSATGMAEDAQDNLYVFDLSNSRVCKFDANGNHKRQWHGLNNI